MNNKILGTSKRIPASFLLNVFCCMLNLKFDFYKGGPQFSVEFDIAK